MSQDRFVVVYREGSKLERAGMRQILLDRVTGIHYLNTKGNSSEGLTPLLGPSGLPLVAKINNRPH